jgi:hypothetical protein
VRITCVAHCALAIAGCATPIGVTRVDPRTAQYELTANALNTDKPSSFSTQQLLNLDLYELFSDNPKEALAKLLKGLAPTGDEERVFALAKLSFLFAENSGDRSYYLAATDGVESEKIIRSSHSVQGNPEAILEIKRILHEHAKGSSLPNEKSSVTLNK